MKTRNHKKRRKTIREGGWTTKEEGRTIREEKRTIGEEKSNIKKNIALGTWKRLEANLRAT